MPRLLLLMPPPLLLLPAKLSLPQLNLELQ
jgi:hypothetical protein